MAKCYRQVESDGKKQCNEYDRVVTYQWQHNFARVGWRGQRKTVENLARVGRKFELDQIQANSIQLEPTQPSGWPNDTQLHGEVVNLAP